MLLHITGNHKEDRREPTEWGTIFGNDANDKGLISKIFKQFKEPNIKIQTTQSINECKI